jgi:cysteine desulfurase
MSDRQRAGPDGVYLDHAASTPMRPEAIEAMAPFLAGCFANPSGSHAAARAAKSALEEAREAVAGGLGADSGEVVFTAGGTEADNLAVVGAARAARARGRGDGVVTCAFEHKAVLAAGDQLERDGFAVRRVPATAGGLVDLDALAQSVDPSTVVVSVMLVNNEVGTIQPLDDVARIVHDRAPAAVLHTDAVQAVPWIDTAAAAAPADLVSVSAHKFGGPKGTGALVVRSGTQIEPLLVGGGQERGHRAGTVNVAGAVAMAAALRATVDGRDADVARVGALRDRLLGGLVERVAGLTVNGEQRHKVAGSCHVCVAGVDAELLLVALDRLGIYAAAGSSCSSGATEPSHVLVAMGVPVEQARCSIRLSLGVASADSDIDRALDAIPDAVRMLRRAA